MRCPICGSENVYVLSTRDGEEQQTIVRRRTCAGCRAKFKTVEVITGIKPFKEASYKYVERR